VVCHSSSQISLCKADTSSSKWVDSHSIIAEDSITEVGVDLVEEEEVTNKEEVICNSMLLSTNSNKTQLWDNNNIWADLASLLKINRDLLLFSLLRLI